MLQYDIGDRTTPLRVKLNGEISDHAQAPLEALARELAGAAVVALDCQQIENITSVGVRHWVAFLGALPQDMRVEFHRCSTFFIDYANLVPMLAGQGEFVSFEVPYRCRSCGAEEHKLFAVGDVSLQRPFPSTTCLKCGQPQTAEVRAEDYLTFLLL
jgi:hypothetical protein